MTPESLLDHADHGRLWSHDPDLDVAAAYQLALQVRSHQSERQLPPSASRPELFGGYASAVTRPRRMTFDEVRSSL